MSRDNADGSDGEPGLAALADADLLSRHREGDREAFGELARRHFDRLWAVALRTTGDREEAADAVQDGLLSAYRAAATFRGEAAVGTWLYRIVVNASLDRLRRRRVRPVVPLPDDGLGEPADPADPVGQRETALDIRAALAALPPDQQAAVVLVYLHGLTVEEAATVLEVAPGTVKSRCARARARLAVLLAPGRNRGVSRDVTSSGPDAGQQEGVARRDDSRR